MQLQQWGKEIVKYLQANESTALGMIEQLVNMDSFSMDGDDVNAVGNVIAGWLAGDGLTVKRLAKAPVPEDEPWMARLGNVLVARTHDEESGAGVVFLGHMDTVYPAGTALARPFRIEGDRAYGPGVADMKAGLVANIMAVRALRELGLASGPMTLVFSPDEELGSPSTTPLFPSILSGAKAVICSEPGYPGGGVTIERKGSGHMHLEITGISAHAGRNYEDGASAILELAHKIIAFNTHLDLLDETTVNTGLISGGTSPNSVAPHATARIHLTFATREAGERLVEQLRGETAVTYIEGTSSRISGGMRLYPFRPTDEVRRMFDFVEKAGVALGYPVTSCRSKGAAESGYCSSVLGLPVVCSMGPEGWELHSPDEYMILSSVIPRCALIALTALQASRDGKP